MPMTEDIYRERAATCRRDAARRQMRSSERQEWLALAEQWAKLADGLALQRGKTEPPAPELLS
jgi:hypothetical protein